MEEDEQEVRLQLISKVIKLEALKALLIGLLFRAFERATEG